ncbi:MAG TPA: hypothetical protein VGL92_08610 [Acidimicrobiia bacterium]|jgi:hypothetical protein
MDEVVAAYPRRDFLRALYHLVLEHAAKEPIACAFTWLHESVKAHVTPSPTFEDAIFGAPFPE